MTECIPRPAGRPDNIHKHTIDMAESAEFTFETDPELASTLPGFTYWDRDWFEREKRRIFRRSWRCIGHVSDIPDAGDYLTHHLVDQPVVVLRTPGGDIRAFHNVCKHRAHLLLKKEQGTLGAALITCPYHAWSYDTDGRLRAAPHCEHVRGFSKSEIRLDPVQVEVVAGFVYINLNTGAPPLLPEIAPAMDRLQALCGNLAGLRRAASVTFTVAGNWKNVGDNLLECYHCHPAHKAFVDLVDMDTYRVETERLWSWQGGICRPRNLAYRIPDGLDDDEREFVTLYIWPDMAFTRFAGSDAVATFVFEAVAPEETRQIFTVYTPSGELDPVAEDIYRYFCDVLGPEDVDLVECVQKGLHSVSYDRGRFFVDRDRSWFSEHAVHHFHALVDRHMRHPTGAR